METVEEGNTEKQDLDASRREKEKKPVSVGANSCCQHDLSLWVLTMINWSTPCLSGFSMVMTVSPQVPSNREDVL
jgi:hypothetical protein